MWRLSDLYARLARPQVAAGLTAVLVAATAGIPSLPEIIRPANVEIPIIKPAKIQAAEVQGVSIDQDVDCSKVACLALTFDDGPHEKYTPRVVNILDSYNAKATFFLIGLQIPGHEQIVRQIHRSGHEIGNHTWSHRDLSGLKPQEVEADIARAQQVITATGVPTPRLFRAPYGAFSPMVRSHVPLTVVSWSIDPEDWKADDPDEIVDHILAHAKPGAIVDLHDIYDVTADALPKLITELQKKYRLVTVSDMLDLPPGQPGIFYSR